MRTWVYPLFGVLNALPLDKRENSSSYTPNLVKRTSPKQKSPAQSSTNPYEPVSGRDLPVYDPKDYLGFVRKAVISSANDATAPLYTPTPFLGEGAIKWLQRAESSITKDAIIIDQARHHYNEKLQGLLNNQTRERNIKKCRMWSIMGTSRVDHEAATLLRNTGDSYAGNIEWLQEVIAWEEANGTPYELREKTLDDCHEAEKFLKVWNDERTTSADALRMAKRELFKFALADAPEADDELDPINHAIKAIAWIMRYSDAQAAEQTHNQHDDVQINSP